MKFKYYLRGVGIGLIVTTLLFTIAFAFYKPTLSDAEIIKKAQALGMEKVEEKKETTEPKKDDTNAASEDAKENTAPAEETKNIDFTIASGDSSATVAQHLQEAGLVDNAKAFDMYLSEQNLDNFLLPGSYQIPEGSTFLEIGELLTTKQNPQQ